MANVFFSYSHKDEALRDQLEAHLAMLKNQGLIDAWYDRRIVAGNEVDDAIFSKLEIADIILLLVSSDFLNSAYCYSREMSRAMERQKAGEARVIPVILRHCDWHTAPFGGLLAAPRDGKPIASWPDRDEALTDVAKHIRRAVHELQAESIAPLPLRQTQAASLHDNRLAGSVRDMPRSSNLRLKKEFTERDRDEFLRSTFDFVCRFFEGSIAAIRERNPDVAGNFERVDTRRMVAVLYRGGKNIAECSVRLEGLGRSDGIAFSHDASVRSNSYNEMLSVEASDQTMFLKTMGMAWRGERDKQLSQEGAAELLWELFIGNAQ